MRFLILMFSTFFVLETFCQSKVKKISVVNFTNFYSYGIEKGVYNSSMRLGEGIGLHLLMYDTLKKKGMTFEISVTNTSGFYKNILSSGNILEVNDSHATLSFIFPIFIMYQKRLEQCLGFGVGATTIVGRDYYDEQNNLLTYNLTTLPNQEAFSNWSVLFMFDYELSLRISKRFGISLGTRFFANSPIHSTNSSFDITQGTGVSVKTGFAFRW